MKVALDCNALIQWAANKDDEAVARLELLFSQCRAVVVPMPAFAEFLAGARDGDEQWLEAATRKPRFKIAPFDRRAAYECARLVENLRAATPGAGKRAGRREDAWQQIKFDRQILAIARVEGCDLLVCADGGLLNDATRLGMQTTTVRELPLPPSAAQMRLALAEVDVQAIAVNDAIAVADDTTASRPPTPPAQPADPHP